MPAPLPDRLEMLLVADWLGAGTPDDGEVAFVVADAAAALGIRADRAGLLEVMSALTELEETHRVRIEWGRFPGAPARVLLDETVRRDARRALEPPPG